MKKSRIKAKIKEKRKWIERLQSNDYFRPIKKIRKKKKG